MKKILPMSDPIIRSFPYYAHVFSVMGVQSQLYIPWVYNYYVQICTSKDFEKEKRVDYVTPDVYKLMPGLHKNFIDRNIALETRQGIIGFIKSYINQGYYIYGLYDVSQIAAFNIDSFFVHDPLLYGYDDEKEEVYFADNYKFGKYSLGIASYKEIIVATEEFTKRNKLTKIDWLPGFRCIRYNDKFEPYQFNKNIYVNLLNDYLEKRSSNYHWMLPWEIHKEDSSLRWGIDVYSVMRDYLLFAREKGIELDKRGFFVQMEHKKLLNRSITYLLGGDWKTIYHVEWQLLEKDINLTTVIMNLCLKYNLTFEKNIIDTIIRYLIILEANDRQLFPCLINLVSNYVHPQKYISMPEEM